MCRLKKGDLVKHFKRELMQEEDLKKDPCKYIYEIISMDAMHTETEEELVVYKSIDTGKYFCRPKELFLSEVDRNKYPNVKQLYRLQRLTDNSKYIK